MDYGFPEKRKSRRDKKEKARYNRYKKGGRFRGKNVNETEGKERIN